MSPGETVAPAVLAIAGLDQHWLMPADLPSRGGSRDESRGAGRGALCCRAAPGGTIKPAPQAPRVREHVTVSRCE
jgi:hypothetical protein